MVELYSNKVYELSLESSINEIKAGLSYLNLKEKEFLKYLLEKEILQFKPIKISKDLKITNKTIINRCSKLRKTNF